MCAADVRPGSVVLESKRLPKARDAVAPDGSDVRILVGLAAGGLTHFELAPGRTSMAVSHRTVEEIWFVLGGCGEIWRKLGSIELTIPVEAGVSLTIPLGTHFQFRSFGPEPLTAIGITMPPWPGDGEAYEVPGIWVPSVKR
jgi:mannose-6-phosphate isomerase-like protein (cupin superfamily)